MARARRVAGDTTGLDKPSLDTLRLAEAPPAPVYVLDGPRVPRPTPEQVEARAEGLLRDPAWLATRERLTSRYDTARAARHEAGLLSLTEYEARRRVPRLSNRADFEAGQRAAARWCGTLDALAEVLDAIEARVPDAWLAAISEESLRTAAETAARLGLLTTPGHDMDTPDARRARCPMHHRHALRRRAATARQHMAALLGTVGHGAAPYADGYAVACWRERQTAARAFGLAHLATFEDGRQIPLWELMETSRKARLAALYAQTLGLDDLAGRRGLLPLFITMTLSPDHHPNPAHGRPYAGQDWQEAPSPRDTDAVLAHCWTLFRARLAADGIALLGLRVVEPHRDGCPHLHALLYVSDEAQAEAVDQHLMAVCPDPDGAPRVASKMVRIDRSRASAASYVMKYILKAVPAAETAAALADGEDRDGDGDHLANHAEVAAWASERRLRRFAWLGLHGLRTVWQRIRRLSDDERATAPESVRNAVAAMGAGAWADALEQLGAVRSDGAARPRLTYAEQENGYGEVVRRPTGLTLDGWHIPLRRQECAIRRATASARPEPTRPTVQDVADNPGITVTVSCPRAVPTEGAEAFPIIRTGPPMPDLCDFDDLELTI